MPRKHLLKNEPERNFEALAERESWIVSKRGWPDFFCERPDGSVFVVEVKPRGPSGRMKHLKVAQIRVLNALQDAEIDCFVSDGVNLEIYNRNVHVAHVPQRSYSRLRPGQPPAHAKWIHEYAIGR
jgi:hypothetical protein